MVMLRVGNYGGWAKNKRSSVMIYTKGSDKNQGSQQARLKSRIEWGIVEQDTPRVAVLLALGRNARCLCQGRACAAGFADRSFESIAAPTFVPIWALLNPMSF
ncbi:hypothetical protein ACM25O_18675 [Sulfitobacter pontiacus]